MQCPICNGETRKGTLEINDTVHMMQPIPMVDWISTEGPEQEHIAVMSEGIGYYCPQCRKVFAEFEEE